MRGPLLHALSAAEWLSVWERCRSQTPALQAATLLTAACRDAAADEINRLTVGERDDCLLALRESTFGPLLESVCNCPHCGEELELAFSAGDLRKMQSREELETFEFADSEYAVRFRLPTGADLAALSVEDDLANNRLRLFESCVLNASRAGQTIAAKDLPDPIVKGVEERMAKADPQADLKLDLTCPMCAHRWESAFDIVSFFWAELNAWARRIFQEVHVLASTYGWTESEILALSPLRRQVYLDKVGS